jgi:hypothetical protein
MAAAAITTTRPVRLLPLAKNLSINAVCLLEGAIVTAGTGAWPANVWPPPRLAKRRVWENGENWGLRLGTILVSCAAFLAEKGLFAARFAAD